MMDIYRLQDRITRGMGLAAQKCGSPYVVYRPAGASQPLRAHNKVIELPAAFQPFGRGAGIGRDAVVWAGTFDGHYTAEGDYLVGDQGTFFIATQRPALPIRCLLTNQVVTIMRQSFTAQGGYSGLYATGAAVIISNWPGYLAGGQSSVSSGGGPVVVSGRPLLLPVLPAAIEVADVVTDGTGASYLVVSAELNAMGWRVTVRAATP